MRSSAIAHRAARHGFTVLELMLSVAIMTVIVIALYTVFDQTQRALRTTMTQVDVLESMRATTDLMTRELEAATPVEIAVTNDASFAVAVNPMSVPVDLKGLVTTESAPVLLRTTIQDIYFATRQNDAWTAIGYWVGPAATNAVSNQRLSVGRLYRFAFETTASKFRFENLFSRYNGPMNGDFRLKWSAPVMDGVIHLRLVAYDRDTRPMVFGQYPLPTTGVSALFKDILRADQTAYWFRRDTVPTFPSSLELEIGILEPQMVTRYASIPSDIEAAKFLARNAGRIHLFRQRIPLRNSSVR